MKRSIGDVFPYTGRDGKKIYWKIYKLITHDRIREYESYHVIRCTSTGKEFSTTNGFRASFVDDIPDEDIFHCAVAVKVSTDGIEVTKRKNRIRFLTNKIQAYKKELNVLYGEISCQTSHVKIKN